ncbi:MAG: hypothetical protein GY754_44380 [bacterium]|nr:hypothetical protein [bacterium]
MKRYINNKFSYSFLLMAVIVLIIQLFSAEQSTAARWSNGLREIAGKDIARLDLFDDLDEQSLEQAIGGSIEYYSKISPKRTFVFGGYSYKPEEMIRSLRRFLRMYRRYDGMERVRRMAAEFHFFKAGKKPGSSVFTAYYEPIIKGKLQPTRYFSAPVYKKPQDLVTVKLKDWAKTQYGSSLTPALKRNRNISIIGRIKGGKLVPYHTRAEIVSRNSIKGKAGVLCYINPIDLFFLQIEGSGIIELPGGKRKQLTYSGDNGHAFVPVTGQLKGKCRLSKQSIKKYLLRHPAEINRVLNRNPRYIFFDEVERGPLGNINVALTPGRSIAMDTARIPRGSLAFIQTKRQAVSRFVLVQDTGSYITGHRVDLFWGTGHSSEAKASVFKTEGDVFLIVAKKRYL